MPANRTPANLGWGSSHVALTSVAAVLTANFFPSLCTSEVHEVAPTPSTLPGRVSQ